MTLGPEVIDGPLDPKLSEMTSIQLATTFNKLSTAIGAYMLDADEPHKFKLASWVRDSDDIFGYAFGLTPVVHIPGVAQATAMHNVFYKTRRDRTNPGLAEEPKYLSLNSLLTPQQQADKTLETFDSHDLQIAITAVNKLGRVAIATKIDRPVSPLLDPLVKLSIFEADPEALVATLPPSSPESD